MLWMATCREQNPPLYLLLTLPFSVYITSRCMKTNVHSWPCDTSGCTTNYNHTSSLCMFIVPMKRKVHKCK